MTRIREVRESPVNQGMDERIAYDFDFASWGTPSSPVVVIKDATGTDVSGTNLLGTPGVAGDVVTTPIVHTLTAGVRYRLECKALIDGNTLEAYCFIDAEV